jgi:uncharacterized protein (UPF0333 family)
LKSRTWLIIGIILIGIIAGSAFLMQNVNSIGVTVDTNGTSADVKISSLFLTPPKMKTEMEQHTLVQIYESNSTVDSIKNDIKAIAKKYDYTANVNIVSQYGTDQLPMSLQVKGTSMVPTLKDGQQIIILKTKDYKVDDIVVAKHPDYGLIVKRLKVIEPDRAYLMSDNRNVEYYTTQTNLGNGYVKVETFKKTSLDTWIPRDNIIGVVKVY